VKAIPQNHFQNCFEGWTRPWHRCIASQGEYFEGDHGGIQQYRDEFANFIIGWYIACLVKSLNILLLTLNQNKLYFELKSSWTLGCVDWYIVTDVSKDRNAVINEVNNKKSSCTTILPFVAHY
jgi:hypothetical protein